MAKRTLLLFAEDQAENGDKLRDVLQSESGGDVEVINLVDIAVEKKSLALELQRCDRILLLCSPLATELIDKDISHTFKVDNGQEVLFDGKTLSENLRDENGNLREKIILVSFTEIPAILHGTAKAPIQCFGIKREKPVTERMLEGEVMNFLISLIKGD